MDDSASSFSLGLLASLPARGHNPQALGDRNCRSMKITVYGYCTGCTLNKAAIDPPIHNSLCACLQAAQTSLCSAGFPYSHGAHALVYWPAPAAQTSLFCASFPCVQGAHALTCGAAPGARTSPCGAWHTVSARW